MMIVSKTRQRCIQSYIELSLFQSAIRQGIEELIANEAAINQVNFFPVSDHDTGTNLSLSLTAAREVSGHYEDYKAYLDALSSSVFDNARGNSGVLFSIFITGLALKAQALKALTISQLAGILENASAYLYQQIEDVVDGSMVSFIKDFAEAFNNECGKNNPKGMRFQTVLGMLETSLNATEWQNPLLKKNGVIDAGALGAFFFFKGFFQVLAGLKTNKVVDDRENAPQEAISEHHCLKEKPKYRYCTEAKLVIERGMVHRAKCLIKSYGDSVLFNEQHHLLRFHVHANDTIGLFDKLSQIAVIKSPKVDDMLRQYQAGLKKQSIALVTDTSADLCPEILERYQVHQIPISVNHEPHEYLDGFSIDGDTLYKKLDAGVKYPTTATPSLGVIRQKINYLKAHYQHILLISISGQLSGTFQAMQKVVGDDKQCVVVDSFKTSGAQGLLIDYAGSLIEKGLPFDEVVQKVEARRQDLRTYMVLKNPQGLVRSGRLSKMKGALATLTNVKPVLSLDDHGAVAMLDKTHSQRKAKGKLMHYMNEAISAQGLDKYMLLHVNALEEATSIASDMREAFKQAPLSIQSVSPAIGLHTGEGVIAVAMILKDKSLSD